MSKWICKCNAVNPVLNWVCHNCGKDWVVEAKAENIKTISLSKDDRIELLEARNKKLEAKLSLAEDLITHPYWATRESEISPSLMERRKNLITALYEEESKNENI